MYSYLCDRCLACSTEVIENLNLKGENIKFTKKELDNYLIYLLEIINKDIHSNNLFHNLNYDFLYTWCEDCINLPNFLCGESIQYYIKQYILFIILNLLTKEENLFIFENKELLNIIKKKIIIFQINKEGNYTQKLYYKQQLVNLDEINIIPYFEVLKKISLYFKKIFKKPIFLANMDIEKYLDREKLNLLELIKYYK